MRVHLVFQGPDGRIEAEILGRSSEFAELVDPEDASVLHAEAFAMHGAEWIIESVEVGQHLTQVRCVPATTVSERAVPAQEFGRP